MFSAHPFQQETVSQFFGKNYSNISLFWIAFLSCLFFHILTISFFCELFMLLFSAAILVFFSLIHIYSVHIRYTYLCSCLPFTVAYLLGIQTFIIQMKINLLLCFSFQFFPPFFKHKKPHSCMDQKDISYFFMALQLKQNINPVA